MKVLGLDPSLTNFGWAVHDTSATGKARCVERGRFQTSTRTLFIERYTDLRSRLRELLVRTGVRYVGCEYPVFNDLWSEGMYGLFLYSCEAMLDHGVDVVFFSPGQVKAHARLLLNRPKIGNKLWEMKKSDMCDAARADTGGKGRWNHNEADAYLVARSAGRFWGYVDGALTKADLTDIERKQFSEVHTFKRGRRVGDTVRRGIEYREGERFFRWTNKDTEDG